MSRPMYFSSDGARHVREHCTFETYDKAEKFMKKVSDWEKAEKENELNKPLIFKEIE